MERTSSDGAGAVSTAALAAALGGFELRDEDVVLAPAPGIGLAGGSPRTAACAGVDRDGRAVLVLRARGFEAVLAAIDALAWCDARGDLLARRLAADAALTPCVVLVLDEPGSPSIAAISTLRTGDLRVFEARSVRTARGTFEDLYEITRDRPDADGDAIVAWNDRLDDGARGLVERVRAGLRRIDPDARPASLARSIVWQRGNATLVALRSARGGLEAEVAGERFDLAAEDDVDRVLEAAVVALLASFQGAPSSAEDEGSVAPPALMPTGPLLSDEELEVLSGS